MDVTNPYEFIGFGDMHITKPYKFKGRSLSHQRPLDGVLAICNQGLGRSRKNFIFGVQTGPLDFQTHPKRWRASPSTILDGFGGQGAMDVTKSEKI
jgi:hypothetical protein